MNYTKGEWEAYITETMPARFTICADNGNKGIAKTVLDNSITALEKKANARLIAAAPDMYEALKLYQSHQQGTSGHYCWKCAEAIDKVLAKAEGK